MTRSTSSATFCIFAKLATSASLSFGLLSTAAQIILLGSRMRIARISRVPLTAAFSRCIIPIFASCWDALKRLPSASVSTAMSSLSASGAVALDSSAAAA